jgi:hypothetical protein
MASILTGARSEACEAVLREQLRGNGGHGSVVKCVAGIAPHTSPVRAPHVPGPDPPYSSKYKPHIHGVPRGLPPRGGHTTLTKTP